MPKGSAILDNVNHDQTADYRPCIDPCYLPVDLLLRLFKTYSHKMTPLTGLGKKPFEALLEKEKLLVQAIAHFPTKCFLPYQRQKLIFFVTFNLLSANAFSLVWSKILSCGNGSEEPVQAKLDSACFSSFTLYRTTECLTLPPYILI